MSILVTGARGAVGRGVVDGLLAAGVTDVLAGGRDPGRIAVPAGARPVAADLGDPDGIDLAGVEQVFCYVAGSMPDVAAAFRTAGVGHVVLLSSQSVVEEHGGEIGRHHADAEQALRDEGLVVTALRPGAFCGNAWGWAPGVRDDGTVELPHPRATTAPIHERDIADVAVAALTDGAGRGESPVLTGPESMTFREQVDVLARELGRELGVREVDPARARERMAEHVPAGVVDSLFDLWADSEGRDTAVSGEVERLTGHRPRTFAQWVREHADEFLTDPRP